MFWVQHQRQTTPIIVIQGCTQIFPSSTSNLSATKISFSFRQSPLEFQKEVRCVQGLNLWRNNSIEVNNENFKGYHKENHKEIINEVAAAYDLLDTDKNNFNVTIWYYTTYKGDLQDWRVKYVRVPRSVNMTEGYNALETQKELKGMYGGFYVFTMATASEHEKNVEMLVQDVSPNAKKIYYIAGTQKFEIPKEEVRISEVFQAVEKAKSNFKVFAWGLADTTLEDVFIKVAKTG